MNGLIPNRRKTNCWLDVQANIGGIAGPEAWINDFLPDD